MAGKSDAFETDLLGLIFNATAIANIADNAATAPLTDLHLALHTADPTDAGTQDASEATYTLYARVAVARTSGEWNVSGDSVNLVNDQAFPQQGAGDGTSETYTHFSVGVAASGATKILYAGTVTPNINSGASVTPRLTSGTTITED